MRSSVPGPAPARLRLRGAQIGIVGLPNVGKSTLFNCLTKLTVPAENFPFCTIEPNTARPGQLPMRAQPDSGGAGIENKYPSNAYRARAPAEKLSALYEPLFCAQAPSPHLMPTPARSLWTLCHAGASVCPRRALHVADGHVQAQEPGGRLPGHRGHCRPGQVRPSFHGLPSMRSAASPPASLPATVCWPS